jgi:EamA domain-containing membrane protein RarD
MAVVAPITAITSAAVPALWGTLRGDALSFMAWLGVAVALVAIGLVSSSNDGAISQISPRVIGESLLAGAGFGTFFIFLDATEAVNAPWPVVGARLLTVVGLVAFMIATRREVVPKAKSALGLIALTGAFDTASNVTFLYATNSGSLTIVAVLSSLYPIATVLLARVVLSERMTRVQLAGFASAIVATGLIAAG